MALQSRPWQSRAPASRRPRTTSLPRHHRTLADGAPIPADNPPQTPAPAIIQEAKGGTEERRTKATGRGSDR
ncbi:hypothetical protein GW17_00008574 [Ensete ventricosum]|uniref:Uncharacterized protein n=1 Tax=Ensete ventricosum TaxID=4639 RepID=A0A427B3Z5_ENSVE|nr:hypothetical protein B296_00006876 [Ensete ventricosum]RWW27019.1 hypothetical protein GW17_00008574 [Ensete ventricosum]RZR80267.1 hypothetical protein BHM03_00006249 [Ensete ventricosum]